MPAPQTRLGTPEHSARLKAERKASWRRIRDGEGFIYIAAEEDNPDLLKVGFSLDPAARCYELKMRLLGFIKATYRQELDLHRLLAGKGCQGEFYPRSVFAAADPLAIPAFLDRRRAA